MTSREEQIARVSNLLTGRCSVALHAAPGVGKTWLADQVIDRLGGESDALIRLDLSVHPSAKSVLEAVFERVTGRTKVEHATLLESWKALREHLVSSDHDRIILLDEFDEVLRFPDVIEFLKLLRELVHRPSVTNCAMLIMSRRSLESIEAHVRGISTLAPICYPEYLGGITAPDLRSVWQIEGELDPTAVGDCLAWSGGYPPLVRYWLALLPLRPDELQGQHQQVSEFDRLVDHLERIGLLNAAAQLVLGPVIESWLREVRQLEALGVLADSPRVAYAEHDAFVACLRRRTLTLNPWGLLGLAELRLRGLIETVLSAKYGSNWAEVVAKTNKATRSALDEAREKQKADERRFGNSVEWLAYTYPQDLGGIILSNWEAFSSTFASGDRQYWRDRFETLAKYRTPVAHNRADVLSESQRLQCRAYAEDVLRAITESQDK